MPRTRGLLVADADEWEIPDGPVLFNADETDVEGPAGPLEGYEPNPRRRRGGQGARAMRIMRSRGISLKAAWGIVKRGGGRRRNPKRRRSGRRRHRRRNVAFGKHRVTLQYGGRGSKGSGWKRPRRSRTMRRATLVNPPRHRRRARHRRRYRSNPAKFKLSGKSVSAIAKWSDYKAKPVEGVVFTVTGWAGTSLIGVGVDMVLGGVKWDNTAREPVFDGIRIGAKVLGGTAWAWGTARLAKWLVKGIDAGRVQKFSQTGTVVSVVLDIIGTILKYAFRATAKVSGVAVSPLGRYRLNGLRGWTWEMLGFGQVRTAWLERQIRDAFLEGHEIAVYEGDGGVGMLKDEVAGTVLVTGKIEGVKAIAGYLASMGEEITVES